MSTPAKTDVRALADRIVQRYRGDLACVRGAGWRVRHEVTGKWAELRDLHGLAKAIAVNDHVVGDVDLAARLVAAERPGAVRSERRAAGKCLRIWLKKSGVLPLVLEALELAVGELRGVQVMEPHA